MVESFIILLRNMSVVRIVHDVKGTILPPTFLVNTIIKIPTTTVLWTTFASHNNIQLYRECA